MKALVMLLACLAATPATADDTRNAFAGLMVRTDRHTQSVRVRAGVQTGRVRWAIVADPAGYQRTGQQSDTDAVVEIDVIGKWAVLGGWRVASTPVLGHRYFQHKPFVGVSAPLPSVFWGYVKTSFGAEVAITAIRHGDDLPTMGVWNAQSWEAADGIVDVGLFLRAELARGF